MPKVTVKKNKIRKSNVIFNTLVITSLVGLVLMYGASNSVNQQSENKSTISFPSLIPSPNTPFQQQPAPTNLPKIIQATTTPSPIKINSQPNERNSTEYICSCSKTCSEISSCTEAQYQLNTCGCSARDTDHDGTACDGVPLHCQN